MQRRQFFAGVESVDRFHQVEDGVAEHAGVVAGGDQPWMRHIGAGQCGQYPGLAQDHHIAART